MKSFLCIINILAILLVASNAQTTVKTVIRWCTLDANEQKKCEAFQAQVGNTPQLTSSFQLFCVQGSGLFNCMDNINQDKADLATFDVGLGFHGSEIYSLRPIAVENYAESNQENLRDLYYYANIVVPKGEKITPFNLKDRQACFAGVGTAEGWLMPLSKLITDKRAIPVTRCNNVVQTISDFMGESCAPGVVSETFNPFGDNSNHLCQKCQSVSDNQRFCTYRDSYAGSTGALLCLHEGRKKAAELALVDPTKANEPRPSLALVRNGEAQRLAADLKFPLDSYELLCPDQQADGSYTTNISNWATCHWGRIQSRMVMTGLIRSVAEVTAFQKFIRLSAEHLGSSNPSQTATFKLFGSDGYSGYNLLFSDFTKNIYVPNQDEVSTFYRWIDNDFLTATSNLRSCPLQDVRWCIISVEEMKKCQRMKSALDARGIKPAFHCILGGGTVACMRLIKEGYADLITLDAGDLYTAGKIFGLVPIATEFYGDHTYYYAVAIIKKVQYLTIATLKNLRICQGGVGKATGWVIPLNIALETRQINVFNGHLMHAYSELVSRGCVPGILNSEYNPDSLNPLNLCELCSAGGDDKCQRDSRDLYYGDTGAFRCLVETGEVAFARHTTILDNTGGRNPDDWARNRRSDDYQLLCPDGRVLGATQWRHCNLGKIPGATVVTGGHKTAEQRESLWRLLRYAQEYYSSDTNEVFQMFHSGFGKSDIMFTDSAVSLKWIPADKQNYRAWLGTTFLRQVENLEQIASPGEAGFYDAGQSLQPCIMTCLAAIGLLLAVWLG